MIIEKFNNMDYKKNNMSADIPFIYPGARFAKDVSLLIIWPKDTHRQGLGVD
jgi:hypothetical protein